MRELERRMKRDGENLSKMPKGFSSSPLSSEKKQKSSQQADADADADSPMSMPMPMPMPMPTPTAQRRRRQPNADADSPTPTPTAQRRHRRRRRRRRRQRLIFRPHRPCSATVKKLSKEDSDVNQIFGHRPKSIRRFIRFAGNFPM